MGEIETLWNKADLSTSTKGEDRYKRKLEEDLLGSPGPSRRELSVWKRHYRNRSPGRWSIAYFLKEMEKEELEHERLNRISPSSLSTRSRSSISSAEEVEDLGRPEMSSADNPPQHHVKTGIDSNLEKMLEINGHYFLEKTSIDTETESEVASDESLIEKSPGSKGNKSLSSTTSPETSVVLSTVNNRRTTRNSPNRNHCYNSRGKIIYEIDDEIQSTTVDMSAVWSLLRGAHQDFPPNKLPDNTNAVHKSDDDDSLNTQTLDVPKSSPVPSIYSNTSLDTKLSEFDKIFGVPLSPARREYVRAVPLGADEVTWFTAAEMTLDAILNVKPIWNKTKTMIYRGEGEKNDWTPLQRFDVLMRCAKWIIGGEAVESLREVKSHVDFAAIETKYFPRPEEIISQLTVGFRPLNPVITLCRVNVWKPFICRLLKVLFPNDEKAVNETYDHLRRLKKPQRSLSSASEESEI